MPITIAVNKGKLVVTDVKSGEVMTWVEEASIKNDAEGVPVLFLMTHDFSGSLTAGYPGPKPPVVGGAA